MKIINFFAEKDDYVKAFNIAVKTTNNNKLGNFTRLKRQSNRLINEDTLQKLYNHPEIVTINREELHSKCFCIHWKFQKVINEIFETNSILTLGYLKYEETNKERYYEPLDVVLNRIYHKDFNEEINMHCWLTLPSSEIIDLTICSTYAKKENNSNEQGKIITKHTDDIKNVKYIPQILGEEYLYQAKILKIKI